MLLPGDTDDDLIQVPLVATERRSPTDAAGEFPAEFQAPLPNRLVRHRNAAGGQHLLDHAQAQREPKIQPYRVADDLRGVAIAGSNKPGVHHRSSCCTHRTAATGPAYSLVFHEIYMNSG